MNYLAKIEAILFAAGEPVELERIAAGLNLDKAAVREQLSLYAQKLMDDERGLILLTLEDSVQLATKPEYADIVSEVLAMKKNTPLSQAAMEVLAVISYNQPVTKSFIEQVRGVESGQVVNNLVEKGLVEEAGRLNLPGRPIAYRTSLHFLRCFGLKSLDELPRLPQEDDGQMRLDDLPPAETVILSEEQTDE